MGPVSGGRTYREIVSTVWAANVVFTVFPNHPIVGDHFEHVETLCLQGGFEQVAFEVDQLDLDNGCTADSFRVSKTRRMETPSTVILAHNRLCCSENRANFHGLV